MNQVLIFVVLVCASGIERTLCQGEAENNPIITFSTTFSTVTGSSSTKPTTATGNDGPTAVTSPTSGPTTTIIKSSTVINTSITTANPGNISVEITTVNGTTLFNENITTTERGTPITSMNQSTSATTLAPQTTTQGASSLVGSTFCIALLLILTLF